MDDLVNEELGAFVAKVRELAIVANRLAWTIEQPPPEPRKAEADRACRDLGPRGNWCEATAGHEGDHWFGLSETWADMYVPEQASPEPVPYPRMVDRVRIDWATLRLVTSSKLAALTADGTFKPYRPTDRGSGWLAEQIGASREVVQAFLNDPKRVLTADNFVRLVLWTGYPLSEFLEDPDE